MQTFTAIWVSVLKSFTEAHLWNNRGAGPLIYVICGGALEGELVNQNMPVCRDLGITQEAGADYGEIETDLMFGLSRKERSLKN